MTLDLPARIENLLKKIKESIETGDYRFSFHAVQRGKERFISYQDALYVLENGVHEEKKPPLTLNIGHGNTLLEERLSMVSMLA